MTAPLTDAIIVAVSRFVDDAQKDTREPSHSDIEFQINRAGLQKADPKAQGQILGKAKRVRNTLSWALENDIVAGERLVLMLINHLRGCGGFRPASPNYVGLDSIENAIITFHAEGFELTTDGELRPRLLENLSGLELTEALESYVRRAKRGADDAALLAGTGKDLLEATAAHILVERNGDYPRHTNFPGLLGMAFVALGMVTPAHKSTDSERVQCKVERSMYELACSINSLRNKVGTGHGRPWLPNVTDAEARSAVHFMGVIAEWLLNVHKSKR